MKERSRYLEGRSGDVTEALRLTSEEVRRAGAAHRRCLPQSLLSSPAGRDSKELFRPWPIYQLTREKYNRLPVGSVRERLFS